MRDEHHRRLERMYLGGAANRYYRPTMRVERGAAEVTVDVRPDFFHSGGAVHGSLLFKLLDDAAFFAVNSLVEREFVLTTSFHVHFLRPVREGRVTARGRVVSRGRRLLAAEAVATDARGREVARGSGTFVPSGLALADVPGYAGEAPAPSGEDAVTGGC